MTPTGTFDERDAETAAAPAHAKAVRDHGKLRRISNNTKVKTPGGLQVYALQLTLSKPQGGLATGTVLRVGGAIASVSQAHDLGGAASASR